MSDEKKETIHLIVSDEENPKIEHKHGGTAKVVSVSLVDPRLAKSHVTAARQLLSDYVELTKPKVQSLLLTHAAEPA